MKYGLHLAPDGRVLSAALAEFSAEASVGAQVLPEGDLADYRFLEGDFVYDPQPRQDTQLPTQLDRIEAQLVYTAMMTDTLLEG